MGSTPGLRKPEGVYFVKTLQGQDNATKDISLMTGTTQKSDISQNARYNSEIQSVVKRPPIAYYNETEESNSIMSVYRYYRRGPNGVSQGDTSYLFQLNGTTLRVGNDSTGAFTTIGAGLLSGSSGYRFTAVTYNDLAIISTGKDNILQSDGIEAWELGSCKATLSTDAGALENSKTYSYMVVFTDSILGDIVNGAISNIVTQPVAAKKVDLSNIPQGAIATCTARKIYRTVGDESDIHDVTKYKLVTTIADNTTTTYEDNTADGALGAALAAVTDDVPRGKFLFLSQERLFVTGDWYSGSGLFSNTVYYSDIFLPHYMATGTADITSASATAASDYYDVIGKNDNDIITGMTQFLGINYIFKQNSIRPYHVKGTPDQWDLGDIITTQGSPSGYSIVPTPYGIMYQGWDYFYIFNGNFTQPAFGDFLVKENILASRVTQSVATYWKGMYMMAYTASDLGHQFHDRVLVYDMVYKQINIDRGGARDSTLYTAGNVNINCFAVAAGGSDEGQLYVGDSDAGYVYKYETVPDAIKYSTKSDIDGGAYTDSSWTGPDTDGWLTRETIDSFEYASDALVRDNWVTSTTDTDYDVPATLGDGSDGSKTFSAATAWATTTGYVVDDYVTESGSLYRCLVAHTSGTFADDLSAGDWLLCTYQTIEEDKNYTNLTIDASVVVVASKGVTINCVGPIVINGTLYCAGAFTINCHTIEVNGVLGGGGFTVNANLIDNNGIISGDATEMGDNTASAMFNNNWADSVTGSATDTFVAPSDIIYVSSKIGVASTGENQTSDAAAYVGGVQINTAHSSDGRISGNNGNIVSFATSILSATTASGYGTSWNGAASGYTYEVQAYMGTPILNYANPASDVGTIRSAPDALAAADTSNFVSAIEVFSENDSNLVTDDSDYSMKVVVPPGASTLDQYIVRTISSTDLSPASHDTILLDVYALQDGTNFQFGIGEGLTAAITAFTDMGGGQVKVTSANTLTDGQHVMITGTTNYDGWYVVANRAAGDFEITATWVVDDATGTWVDVEFIDVPVTAAETWETVELDFSAVTDAYKNSVTKIYFRMTNTTDENIIYLDNLRPTVGVPGNAGVVYWTSPVMELDATRFGTMFWNENLRGVTGNNVTIATRNGAVLVSGVPRITAGGADCSWSATELSDPSGSQIKAYLADGTTETSDPVNMKYFQFRVTITIAETQTPNVDYALSPYLYVLSTYMLKMTYVKTQAGAETAVEFKYRTGYRNFDTPLADKIFKKIISIHEGGDDPTAVDDTVTISYGLDYVATWPTFEFPAINLASNPRRWESFFPDSAFGRDINFQWYKNDIYNFKVKQIGVVIESEPII